MLRRIDHIYLSVSDFARSEAFYDAVMRALGQHKGDKIIGGVGKSSPGVTQERNSE